MSVMKKTFILIFAALGMALTSKGDVINHTVDFGTLTGDQQYYFSQFDTSLGTLTEVALTWTVNSSISSAFITNQNTSTVTVSRITFTNTVEGYLPSVGMDGDLVAEVAKSRSHTPSGGAVVLTQGQTYSVNNITFTGFSQEDVYTSADANFDSFKGTGDVPLFLTNTFGATPTASGSGSTTSWLTSITGSSTGSLAVTYTYTASPIAPVPEPSALLMSGGGILFLGMLAFRRKTPSAVMV